MVTLKIFICLLYTVYLTITACTSALLLVAGNVTKNGEKTAKPLTRFMCFMFVVDHLLLVYFTVNYIKFIIGR